ncbi:MAG: DUF411 domain-containing protein [Phyllobacterium sp.]
MSGNLVLSRRTMMMCIASSLVVPSALASNPPKVFVSKDPNCGCCDGWVDHMQAAGFEVDVSESSDMGAVKARLGVPEQMASCHTAEVGGYVIEGHVPADAVRQLLAEKPDARGLAVPGMPVGSPGMEVDGVAPDTYDVILFGESGARFFARYRGGAKI